MNFISYLLCMILFLQTIETLSVTEKTTLKDLCVRFNINATECNCQKHNGLCELLKRYKLKNITMTDETIYVCNLALNHFRATSNTIISTVGLIGNGLVLLLPITKMWVFTNSEMLFLMLAVSDFLTCIIRLWNNVPYYWSCKWVFGWLGCKLSTSLLNSSSLFSIGMITLIAIERYLGIVRPFHSGLSRMQLLILTCFNGLMSLGMISPLYLYTNLDEVGVCFERWPKWWYSLIYSNFILVFFSILPTMILSILYWEITKTLKESTRVMIESKMITSHVEERRIMKNKRVMNIVITITVLFVIFVFPNRIIWIIKDSLTQGIHENYFSKGVDIAFYFLSSILYSLQAVVNPIIYSLIDRSFRKHIIELITCRRLKRRQSSNYLYSTTRTEIARSPQYTSRGLPQCTTERVIPQTTQM